VGVVHNHRGTIQFNPKIPKGTAATLLLPLLSGDKVES
jgi:hypothetical protein